MILQDGRVYRAPDGRRFRAASVTRRYDHDPGWFFVSIELPDWQQMMPREYLPKSLCLEKGRLLGFDLERARADVVDTGWTLQDLVPEP